MKKVAALLNQMKLMREKENRNSFSGGIGGLKAWIHFLYIEYFQN
jgi:hypothetical protein